MDIDLLTNTWRKVVYLWHDFPKNDRVKRRVVLSNQISISLFVLGIPFMLLFVFVIKQVLIVEIAFILLICCLTIPYLNSRGRTTFSRVFLCLTATVTTVIAPLIAKISYPDTISLNMYYGPRIFLLTYLTIPLLLIDLSEKKIMAFCIAVNVFFLFGMDRIDNFFNVGFFQMGFESVDYLNIHFYVLLNFLFILSALIYLQINNRNFEMTIKDLNRTLDRRVQQKTTELELANTNLAAFNYMVSHELKTPLTAAQMLSGTLTAKFQSEKDVKSLEQISTLNKCMVEMQNLVKSILSFSRLTKHVEHASKIKMTELVNEIIHELHLPDVFGGKTKISTIQLPEAQGDRSLIKQVWMNLLTNAVKYSQYNEKIIVEIGGKKENGEVIYFVKDNGAGFSAEERDKLFQLFTRLHSKSKYEGTGVGLAITKRIVNMHGGRIWAEGLPDKGATFYFSLPESN